MGSTKKTETKENSTQTVAPPSWTMPGIADAASRVTGALDTLPGVKYGGDFIAQPNAALTQQTADAYTGAAAQSTDLSRYMLQQIQQDPRAAIEAAIHPVFKQLTEQVLPGIQSSAISSGAYSGDRANTILPGMAIRDSNESAQRIAAEIGERRLQMLPEFANTSMGLSTGAGDLLAGANQVGMQGQQLGIDNELARQQYELQYPFQGLDMASALLARLSGNYGTTTRDGTSTQTQTTSGLGNIVQGALGAASLAGSLFAPGAGMGLSSLFKTAAPAMMAPTRQNTGPFM